MSASEKLKALDEKALAPWYYEGENYEDEDFRPFLPQIVAVVEAAEKLNYGTFGQASRDALAAALTDLEEAFS